MRHALKDAMSRVVFQLLFCASVLNNMIMFKFSEPLVTYCCNHHPAGATGNNLSVVRSGVFWIKGDNALPYDICPGPRWGSESASPDPLADFRGRFVAEEREGTTGKRDEEGRGKGNMGIGEGKRGRKGREEGKKGKRKEEGKGGGVYVIGVGGIDAPGSC